MSQGEHKPESVEQEKEKMLDELESLSRMLDDDKDDDIEEDSRPVPEDIPILKSFVDDVPVLNDSLLEEPSSDIDSAEEVESPTVENSAGNSEPPTLEAQPSDSLDRNAGTFSTMAMSSAPRSPDKLDMSFLDKDPLEISDQVRNRNVPQLDAGKLDTEYKKDSTTKPVESVPAADKPATTPTAAELVTKPLDSFQARSAGENPFLPRSTLEKIRENHSKDYRISDSDDASAQLRKLIQENPLNKVSFDGGANSKEFRDLRQKASQMVNEIIRANLPRLEAELRMKLEQEVDRLFKDVKKNPS